MNPEILKGFLRIGIFIGLAGIIMAFLQPPDSAEFVLSVCSGIIGLLLVMGVVLVYRLTR